MKSEKVYNSERTLEQIEKEIAETKAALLDVHGTETEVYARIVGYYRAVKHWNNGKRDEFNQRRMFTLEASNMHDSRTSDNTETSFATSDAKKEETVSKDNAVCENLQTQNSSTGEIRNYELYTRKTCPNCPPVKAFMEKIEIDGTNIDVDTEEGLAKAAKNGVFASPTVIFYDASGNETARCHNVEELKEVMNTVTVLA